MLLCAAMLLCTPAMAASDEGEVPEEAPVQSSDIPAQLGTPNTGADLPTKSDQTTEVPETPRGGESSVEVRAMSGGVEPFSVTLPTSLSVTIGADGSHVSQTARIENTGAATIKVTDVSCTPASGWMLRDYDNMDPNVLPLGEHSVGFKIRQAGGTSYSKSLDTIDVTFQYYEDSFAEIPHGNFADLEYDIRIPAQPIARKVKLMDVTFVVSAYHSYTWEITARYGSFRKSDYLPHDVYVHTYSTNTDVFSVSVYDNGVPIVLSYEQQQSIEWYSVEEYFTDTPTPTADWQFICSGNEAPLRIDLYGLGNAIFIKACLNGHQCIAMIQPISS